MYVCMYVCTLYICVCVCAHERVYMCLTTYSTFKSSLFILECIYIVGQEIHTHTDTCTRSGSRCSISVVVISAWLRNP